MKNTVWFKHEVRMAEIAYRESCMSNMIWHAARAGMLINHMSPEDFIEIPEDVWNRYEELDMLIQEVLDREEQVMNVAEEAIA